MVSVGCFIDCCFLWSLFEVNGDVHNDLGSSNLEKRK